MLTALLVVASLATLQALAFFGLAVRATLKLPRLKHLDPPAPASWPTVSLLVPARDEAQGLEAALRSKLALDYPALQVVLIDDRSTDETGAIADRLAANDPRLLAVHVRELPEGWLEKVNALQRGLEQSSGEWLLLSDADIHYAPDTLRRAIAHCETRGLDLLCALPTFTAPTPLVNACLAAFAPLVLAAVQADWVEDPLEVVARVGHLCARSPERAREVARPRVAEARGG
ncbi:MAG: glycosyltransferase [Myxococcaceae bacterium]